MLYLQSAKLPLRSKWHISYTTRGAVNVAGETGGGWGWGGLNVVGVALLWKSKTFHIAVVLIFSDIVSAQPSTLARQCNMRSLMNTEYKFNFIDTHLKSNCFSHLEMVAEN